MVKKIYNKLVRDKIPEVISKNGDIAEFSVLNDKQFAKALKQKMIEEANELALANSEDEIINELSDIEELVLAICRNNGISKDTIENQRQKKFAKRGGFSKKLLLKFVEEK